MPKHILKSYVKGWQQMNYDLIKNLAKQNMEKCDACRICDTKKCAGIIPGPGGKGTGSTSIRNCEFWRNRVKLNMDVLMEPTFGGHEAYGDVDTSIHLFNTDLKLPVMAAPIGLVDQNWGRKHDEYSYAKAVLEGCDMAGTFAFTGGGAKQESFTDPLSAMVDSGIKGVPTIKPWEMPIVEERMRIMASQGIKYFAMDIDSAGLPNANTSEYKMMLKSPADITNICDFADILGMKFIVKGVMTVKTAYHMVRAGAYSIVVSNHGGRAMDDGLSTGEVLKNIRNAVGNKTRVLVDGGIRTGNDVVKAIALGADGVLIGRPVAIAAYGGNAQGVAMFMNKIQHEMVEVMKMTGCRNINDIDESIITMV